MDQRSLWKGARALRQGFVALLFVGACVAYSGEALAQQKNTGGKSQTDPKCKKEYEDCAANCKKTIIDIDNNVQNCVDKCRFNADMYCSRTLTRNPVTKVPPAGGVLQRK